MSQSLLTSFYCEADEDDEMKEVEESDLVSKSTNQLLMMSQKRMEYEKYRKNNKETLKNKTRNTDMYKKWLREMRDPHVDKNVCVYK